MGREAEKGERVTQACYVGDKETLLLVASLQHPNLPVQLPPCHNSLLGLAQTNFSHDHFPTASRVER